MSGRDFTRRPGLAAAAWAAVVLGACVTDDLGVPAGDPGAPPEVRGVRLIPGDGAVKLRFLEAPGAETYTACVHVEPDPLAGECVRDVDSPYVQKGLKNGERVWWAVVAENEAGAGPVVEVQSVLPGSPERPLAIHAEMTPSDLETLYSRSVRSNARLPVTLALGDESGPIAQLDEVRGIRFRGHSARGHPRKSYHIRLDERPRIAKFPDFNFRGLGRRAGDRILLNQTWTDPTGIRPALAFAMYGDLGLPAPTTFFADWWLNGVYEGHYIGIERIDREALRRWWLGRERGSFTLVRDRSRHRADIDAISMFAVDPDTLGEDDVERIARLQTIYDTRGDADDQNWEALLSLLRWVRDTPAGPEWEAGLKERFHVDDLLDVIAVHSMQYDFDSFADDYWLYRDEDDGRWRVIPWDKNLTFGQRWYPTHGTVSDFFYFHGDITDHVDNPLFDRTVATLGDRLDARIRELYEQVFGPAWFDERIDELAAQVRASQLRWPEPAFEVHPQQHFTDPGWFAWHLEALREFPRFRRAFLTAERSSASPYRFEGKVSFDERGVAWITDSRGWVLLRLEGGDPDTRLELRVEVVEAPGLDGVEREWHIESFGEPFTGELTLPYKNRPGETWLPELEAAGRNWELTVVEGARNWLPTRVNPFANTARAELTLDGAHRLRLLYR